jgi:twinkle protein
MKTFQDFGINIPGNKVSGQVKTLCPRCSDLRKHKSDPCLSVNLDQGVWNCHNCGFSGTLKEQKKYTLPVWENKTSLPQEVVEYFLKRNISAQALIDMHIGASRNSKGDLIIDFPYYKNGVVVNIKRRLLKEKKFSMVADAELILYNIDCTRDAETVIVVEGEIDALTLISVGIKNVVSVPNGASKGNQKLSYLDDYVWMFDSVGKIVVMTDDDEPGNALAAELARRLGVEKCVRAKFEGYKDANDALCATGKLNWIEVAMPVQGVTTFAEMIDLAWAYRIEGPKEKGFKPAGKIGDHVSIVPGQLWVVTGIPSHGKSQWVEWLSIQAVRDGGLRVCFFSPEHFPAERFVASFIDKIIGRKNFSQQAKEIASEIIGENFFLLNPENGSDLETIVERMRFLIKHRGVNVLVVDPWNTVSHSRGQESGTDYIGRVLEELKTFARNYHVTVIIVAHPSKPQTRNKNGEVVMPDAYSISDSAHWYNKSDVLVIVHVPEKEFSSAVTGVIKPTTIRFLKVKDMNLGGPGDVIMLWDIATSGYKYIDEHQPKPLHANKTLPPSEELVWSGPPEEPPI